MQQGFNCKTMILFHLKKLVFAPEPGLLSPSIDFMLMGHFAQVVPKSLYSAWIVVNNPERALHGILGQNAYTGIGRRLPVTIKEVHYRMIAWTAKEPEALAVQDFEHCFTQRVFMKDFEMKSLEGNPLFQHVHMIDLMELDSFKADWMSIKFL